MLVQVQSTLPPLRDDAIYIHAQQSGTAITDGGRVGGSPLLMNGDAWSLLKESIGWVRNSGADAAS